MSDNIQLLADEELTPMPDNLKYFLYGLLLGSKQLEREKTPISIYIEYIVLGYDDNTLILGDSAIITSQVYPNDASHQVVEWSSSDTEIFSVQKASEFSCIIRTYKTGTAILTCMATDGSGVQTQLTINVIRGIIFETLALNTQTLSYMINTLETGEAVIVYNYTPIQANGNKMDLSFLEMLSGNENSVYDVVNTCFENIKLIKCNYSSKNVDDYYNEGGTGTSGSAYLNILATATDGSGLTVNTRNALSKNSLFANLYGIPNRFGDIDTVTKTLVIGYSTYLTYYFNGNQTVHQSFYGLEEMTFTIIEGDPETIEIGARYKVTALKVGTVKILMECTEYYKCTITINCVENGVNTNRPTVELMDENGCFINNYTGLVGRFNPKKIYPVAVGNNVSAKILNLVSNNTTIVTVNDDGESVNIDHEIWGTTTVTATVEYATSSGIQTRDINAGINYLLGRVYAEVISSNYLKSGVAVGFYCNYYYGQYDWKQVNVEFNANDLELLGVYDITSKNTLTTTLGISSDRPAKVYWFNKLSTRQSEVKFSFIGYPNNSVSVTI